MIINLLQIIERDQLDKMKQQVQDMELKWDEAENKHSKLIAELEEKKTQKYMDLMDAESKVIMF